MAFIVILLSRWSSERFSFDVYEDSYEKVATVRLRAGLENRNAKKTIGFISISINSWVSGIPKAAKCLEKLWFIIGFCDL